MLRHSLNINNWGGIICIGDPSGLPPERTQTLLDPSAAGLSPPTDTGYKLHNHQHLSGCWPDFTQLCQDIDNYITSDLMIPPPAPVHSVPAPQPIPKTFSSKVYFVELLTEVLCHPDAKKNKQQMSYTLERARKFVVQEKNYSPNPLMRWFIEYANCGTPWEECLLTPEVRNLCDVVRQLQHQKQQPVVLFDKTIQEKLIEEHKRLLFELACSSSSKSMYGTLNDLKESDAKLVDTTISLACKIIHSKRNGISLLENAEIRQGLLKLAVSGSFFFLLFWQEVQEPRKLSDFFSNFAAMI
eukprot:TRINITY_DN18431_c0_g1_i1.p1 TRINITY_DN18431_c0_g1~~TRINITY_DN18431_c0_g1_i1.p1  ORF type:complete len:322 (-),score=64.43 TRINITY_DN18431_c0_g1_i1:143-1039(-)